MQTYSQPAIGLAVVINYTSGVTVTQKPATCYALSTYPSLIVKTVSGNGTVSLTSEQDVPHEAQVSRDGQGNATGPFWTYVNHPTTLPPGV